jgi:hypothetical protein
VTITGTSFTDATKVRFGGVAATTFSEETHETPSNEITPAADAPVSFQNPERGHCGKPMRLSRSV